jgi:hypothetical protein
LDVILVANQDVALPVAERSEQNNDTRSFAHRFDVTMHHLL